MTPVPDTPRAALLQEAMEIVHKDRNANYGNPEDNFLQIAALWTSYFQGHGRPAVQFTSADVAIMNMLIKVARLAKNPNHHDSAVDIAGYAACLADIQSTSLNNSQPKGVPIDVVMQPPISVHQKEYNSRTIQSFNPNPISKA